MEGYILGAIIAITLTYILFKSVKAAIAILKNAIVGFAIIFIYSYFTEIPINIGFFWWIVMGILGVPGAVLLILYRWQL